MPPRLLDAHELATTIGETYEDVLKWSRLGYIPVIHVGGRKFFNLRRVVEATRERQQADQVEAVAC